MSNLSYQFFGKVNDPETAKYYERFFEIVKNPTRSISRGTGLSWEARITKGEKEVPKRRAQIFFRLKQGEFIVFADGKDKKIRFERSCIRYKRPMRQLTISKIDLKVNFEQVYGWLTK